MKPTSALSADGAMPASLNYERLSGREREVLELAARGLPNKAIASELRVTEGTVKLHLHKIYQKLGIKGRFALVLLANELPLQWSERIRLMRRA